MADPQITPIVERRHAGGFMVSEARGRRSRDAGTLASGQANVSAGTVLGRVTVGAAAAVAFATASGDGHNNTGDGTIGTITVSAGAKPGRYKLTIIEAAANAGTFMVEDPDGVEIGTGVVGAAFSAGGLAFTLSDGTDFVAGDGFNITVAAGSGKYAVFDPTAANGSQNAAAILWDFTDATSADKPITVVIRDCEVNASELVWGANVTTDNQKSAARAQLAALGVIAR